MAKFPILILILFGLFPVALRAYPSPYMELRARYLEKFFSTEDGPGTGIPAARFRHISCSHSYWMQQTCDTKTSNNPATGILEWDDGTVHLGFHFFTFSLEYRYNETHTLPQDQTLLLLRSGLQALRRLEQAASRKQNQPAEPGFFLRDDAGHETLQHFPHAACIRSNYLCNLSPDRGNLMSQDQLIYLLWGLQMLEKTIPENVKAPGDSLPLSLQARQIMLDCISRLYRDSWRILDLRGETHIGYQAWFYGAPLAKWYRSQLGRKASPEHQIFWKILQQIPYSPQTPLHNEVNAAMQLAAWSFEGKFSEKMLNFAEQAQMDIFPAYAWILSGQGGLYPGIERLDSLTRSISPEGPHFLSERSPVGWRGENRWFHPDRNLGLEWERYNEFNGLDAMSLWLAHTLIAGPSWQSEN